MKNISFGNFVLLFLLLFIFIPLSIIQFEFPRYRLVLDPGHGGISKRPLTLNGDRYDTISGKYLSSFKEGASYGKYKEHLLMFDIAEKTHRLLKDLSPGGDFSRFVKIFRKYSDSPFKKIHIETMMSRKESISRRKAMGMEDPNKGYRLFDGHDKKNNHLKGRLSKINEYKPHLVVSLHCATKGPRNYQGMSAVIVPPYSFMKKGLDYLRKEKKGRSFFYESGFKNWFCENSERIPFKWFLSDTSMYFTGYPLDNDMKTRLNDFRGYRYNMLSWAYRDGKYWEMRAKYHRKNTNYSSDYMNFRPSGRFWEREMSDFENYRRARGQEGFGGDNLYASNELIRFIMYSLQRKGFNYRHTKPSKPYVSIWILPMHVNAINAFLELGYLSRRKDRYMMVKKQNEIAEGLAVGIYSLFTGLEIRKGKLKNVPLGKRIDLEKYRIDDEETYFNEVSK